MNPVSSHQFIGMSFVPYMIVNRDTEIVYISPDTSSHIKTQVGFNIQIGMSLLDFVPEYNMESMNSALDESFFGNPVKRDFQFGTDNNGTRYFECIFTPVFDENHTVNSVSLCFFRITGFEKILWDLQASEERYGSLVSLQTNLLLRIDSGFNITYVNDACCEFIGVSREQLFGVNIFTMVYPDDLQYVMERSYNFMSSQTRDDIEFRVVTKNGVKWLHLESVGIRNDDGSIKEVQAIGRDITETRNTLEELIHTKYRFGAILSNFSNLILYEAGRDDSFISTRVSDLLGYDVSELKRNNFVENVIFSEDAEKYFEAFNKWKEKDDSGMFKRNFRCVKSNGELIWVENLLTKAQDSKGVFYCGVLQDITERIKSENRTVRNEALLRIMTESARFGYYIVNYNTDDVVYINTRFCELWGIDSRLTRNYENNLKNSYIRDLCSEKAADTEKFIENAMFFRIPGNDIAFEDEMPLKNGKVLRRFSTLLTDADNKYIGRFFLIEDITDKTLYEKTIKSQKDFGIIIEEAVAGIIIINTSGIIISANKAIRGILGYDDYEMTGMNFIDLFFEKDLTDDPVKFTEIIEGKTVLMKAYFRKKDGNSVFLEGNAKLLPNHLVQAIVWERKETEAVTHSEPGINIFSSLISKVKAFKHGENSLMCLNRISLFLKNKDYLETARHGGTDKDGILLRKRFERLLSEYIETVYPQLEFISAHLNVILNEMPRVSVYNDISGANEKLMTNSRILKNKLVELRITLRHENGVIHKSVGIVELVKICITSIKQIAKNLEENFITDVNRVLESVCEKQSLENPGISLNYSCSADVTHAVFNEVELKEISDILINNSIEAFTDINKSDFKKRINIELTENDGKILLSYSDNGPGFSDRIKKQIFVKGISTKGVNRGFGLYYAKSIIGKYGGDIILDKNFGDGARFVISFILV